MKNFFKVIMTIALLTPIAISCDKGPAQPDTITVTGVSLNKTDLALKEGEEFTLVATVSPDKATNKAVNWSSDNDAIVSVSNEGVVKALKAGKAMITATTVDQGMSASCSVEVAEVLGTVTGDATHISCRNAEISGKAKPMKSSSEDLTFGILYGTSSELLIGSATQIQADSFDLEYNFTIGTGVLEPETEYYFCSYIVQSGEISYGEIKLFKTLPINSMIQTLDVTDVHPKDAAFNASLNLTDCKYDNLEYGFEITPEGGSSNTIIAFNHSEGKYSIKDESLSSDTKYSFVAYVILDGITYKSEVKTFTTASVQASVSAETSNVRHSSATISGKLNVASVGTFTKSAMLYYSSTASTPDALKASGTKETLALEHDDTFTLSIQNLTDKTNYFYCIVAKVDDSEFTYISTFMTEAYPCPDCVDLGLSVKWASFNLGATKPEEYGEYYQWAGTEDVSDRSLYIFWNNCPYHTGTPQATGWTKYVPSSKPSYWSGEGSPDNKFSLSAEDDVAHVKLGEKWRMPTSGEIHELTSTTNCTWTWITINGVDGYKVTSKKPGYTDKWIFLPAAGRRSGYYFDEVGTFGYYWSSTNNYTLTPIESYELLIEVNNHILYKTARYYGQTVRPVSD